MGNVISIFGSDQQISTADFQLIGKSSIIRWGELFEMKNIKTGEVAFMQEKYSSNFEIHQRSVQTCSYHLSLRHKNLATLYGFAHTDDIDIVTNTYKLCIFFEHIASNLREVIRLRRPPSQESPIKRSKRSAPTPQYFTETELLSFLHNLLNALSFLQSNGINQGDITPDVCLIAGDGTLKILERKLIFNDVSAFDLGREGATYLFLTPAELEALKNGEPQPSENRYKADVFRLGMTLLECATLKKSAQIYNYETHAIDLEILAARLIEVRERYSPDFYNPLREMLRFEEHTRPDFITLFKNLQEETPNTINSSSQLKEEERKSVLTTAMGPKLTSNFLPSSGSTSLTELKNDPSKTSLQESNSLKKMFKDALERGKQRASVKNTSRNNIEDDTSETGDDLKINAVPYTQEVKNPTDNNTSLHPTIGNLDSKLPQDNKSERVEKLGEPISGASPRLPRALKVTAEQLRINPPLNNSRNKYPTQVTTTHPGNVLSIKNTVDSSDSRSRSAKRGRQKGLIFGAPKQIQEMPPPINPLTPLTHKKKPILPEPKSPSPMRVTSQKGAIFPRSENKVPQSQDLTLQSINSKIESKSASKPSTTTHQDSSNRKFRHIFDERPESRSGKIINPTVPTSNSFNANGLAPMPDDSPFGNISQIQRLNTSQNPFQVVETSGSLVFEGNIDETRNQIPSFGIPTEESSNYGYYSGSKFPGLYEQVQNRMLTRNVSQQEIVRKPESSILSQGYGQNMEAFGKRGSVQIQTFEENFGSSPVKPAYLERSTHTGISGTPMERGGYYSPYDNFRKISTPNLGSHSRSPLSHGLRDMADQMGSHQRVMTPLKDSRISGVGTGEMKVDDRFEQAMERSRRSKVYMKEMATNLSRSTSRKGSIDIAARGNNGLNFHNGFPTPNKRDLD